MGLPPQIVGFYFTKPLVLRNMSQRPLPVRSLSSSRRSLQFEALENRELMALGIPVEKSFALAPAHVGSAAVSSVAREGAAARANLITDDAYEQNDTFATAYNLGTLTAPKTLGSLAMADSADWYKFTMTKPGVSGNGVTMSFLHSQGDLDLALYNIYGQRLRISESVTNSETVSLSGLAAGTYYVRAYGYLGATNPAYALSVNVGSSVADDAYENNDSFSAASNLGTLTAEKNVSGLVLADSADWYKFSMNGPGTSASAVSLSFQNSLGNLNLDLYNSAGTRLANSTSLMNSESVSLAGRAAGTYYIRVYSPTGVTNSTYSLAVNPGVTTATVPPASGSFDIQFVFNGLSTAQQAIFEQAAAKWESIIVGDLPSVTYNGQVIDDLLVTATSTSIDGVGNILGQAGPDRLRSGSLLPYAGSMEFDSADLASMQSDGTLLGVIEHEMGHVLGIGTLWESKGLLVGAGTSNPLFTGTQAVAAYNSIFGTAASGVPVENTGGSGTADAHWRESIFRSELMTGWVGPSSTMPLSRVTVGSLADLGYSVNMAAADAFTPSASLLAATASSVTSASTASLRETVRRDERPVPAAHDAALVSFLHGSEPALNTSVLRHTLLSSIEGHHEAGWEDAVDHLLSVHGERGLAA
jgi:hypothetical protein